MEARKQVAPLACVACLERFLHFVTPRVYIDEPKLVFDLERIDLSLVKTTVSEPRLTKLMKLELKRIPLKKDETRSEKRGSRHINAVNSHNGPCGPG